MKLTLEKLLTSPHAFGLASASPLQRAICRIADGLPLGDLAAHPDVVAAVGDVASLTNTQPGELGILSGIRTGKSLLAAALAVRATQTCDISRLGPGETARVSVVSLTTDLAKVILDHVVGNVQAKPALKALLIGEPTSDSLMLKHPSGRAVEIKIVAGARAGSSLVARWSAGCIFDEAPRMVGADDGVVNFDDARRSVLGRLLDGAQLVWIGSPWAPFGPIYEATIEHWKKPTAHLVIVRAPAPAMNPVYWTSARVESLRQKDAQTHRTDVLAEFCDAESSLFSSTEIDTATRARPLELQREPGHQYVAAMDPATRGNAWTLVIATKRRVGLAVKSVVVLARQWIGSKASPLSPAAVLAEIAELCKSYGIDCVATDQYSGDALRDIAYRHELYLHIVTVTAANKLESFESMRTRIADDAVELSPEPQLRADLLSVRKRITQSGVAIDLPRTADGRHCDYAPALALVLTSPLSEPEAPRPKPGTPEFFAEQEERIHEQIEANAERARNPAPWWGREHEDEAGAR